MSETYQLQSFSSNGICNSGCRLKVFVKSSWALLNKSSLMPIIPLNPLMFQCLTQVKYQTIDGVAGSVKYYIEFVSKVDKIHYQIKN